MREWYKAAISQDKLTITIKGSIGQFCFEDSAAPVQPLIGIINLAGERSIAVDINLSSNGGNADDAFTIFNALNECLGPVTVYINQLAASAALYIVAAADRIVVAEGSRLVFHEASSLLQGNKRDLAYEARTLASIDDTIARALAARSALTTENYLVLMQEGAQMDCLRAVDCGLVDSIVPSTTTACSCERRWGLSSQLADNHVEKHLLRTARTPAEVIEDRQTIMEEAYGFWQGEKEYFTDYHDLYGDEYLDVSLGVCASPRELFEALYEVFTKDFFIDFVIWCYTDKAQ